MEGRISKLILFLSILFNCLHFDAISQVKSKLVSGPWAGNIELKNAVIWLEVGENVRSVSVDYYPSNNRSLIKTAVYKGQFNKSFNPVKIELNGLSFNTTYNYLIKLDGKAISIARPLSFTTKELWQYRKPAPDFTFLAGSCAYFNEPLVDRPGVPYGGDSSIFETAAKIPAAFHLWLGDNWYTREVDFFTPWGLNYRASRDRSQTVLQRFMSAMPHYAIWDDHDFGPNDIGKSYELKDVSRKVFMDYWCNPSYGEDGEGIYTRISYGDVDIFLTDDRYFRSEDLIKDSIDGALNDEKTYFGKKQLDWLQNALVFSKATFKIIASGSQMINPLNQLDCFINYKKEYNQLMQFLERQKINGVIFLTGDRHHSEILKLNRKGTYPLYDITSSPYTAGISKVRGPEVNHPDRIQGTLVEEQNFAQIKISGEKGNRNLSVEFIGLKGNSLSRWRVNEKELK